MLHETAVLFIQRKQRGWKGKGFKLDASLFLPVRGLLEEVEYDVL